MALAILLDGTDRVAYLLDKSLRITTTTGDREGRCDFTLVGVRPNQVLDTLVISDGSTTYFTGEVYSYTFREYHTGKWFCDVVGHDTGPVPGATVFSPFSVSDVSAEDTYQALMNGLAPIVWWRLGEASGTTAYDETGTRNGSYVGSPTLGVAGAMTTGDTAVTLNGSSQYLPCGTTALVAGGDFSIAAWFKTSYSGASQAIYAERNTASANAITRLRLDTSGHVLLQHRDDAGLLTTVTSTGNYIDDAWHLAVGTMEGTDMKVYVDGFQVGSGTRIGSNTLTINRVQLGHDYHDALWFHGSLDEVMVFDFALSRFTGGGEVASLYQARDIRPYVSLQITNYYDALASPVTQRSGTLVTYDAGLAPGQAVDYTSANVNNSVLAQINIEELTTRWINATTPEYTATLQSVSTIPGAKRFQGVLARLK